MNFVRGSLKQKRKEMVAENEELRGALGLEQSMTVEAWESAMPQEMRDTFAARSLVTEYGNLTAALIRLGFPKLDPIHNWREVQELRTRIFETPGVKAILNIGKIEDYHEYILKRQAEIALHGDNAESTRAAQMLARTLGWQKTPDIHIHQNRQTIYALVNQKNSRGEVQSETIEALADDFLTHEPGGPKRIDSGDERILTALNPGEDADTEFDDDNG